MFKLSLNTVADFEGALIEAVNKACEKKNQLNDKIIEQVEDLKKSINSAFYEKIKENKGLSDFDEKIYDCYFELITYYKKAVEIYNQDKNKLTSEKVIKLLEGLESVLNSRIAQFEEILNIVECKDEAGKFINPILLEKNNLIELAIKGLEKELSESELKKNEKSFNDNLAEIYEKINELFLSALKKCVLSLNDIEKREVTAFYFEMLKEERELLSSVIKVQADALEKEEQTEEEESFIQDILFQLREAYQHIKKYVDALIERFIAVDNRNVIAEIKIQDYCDFRKIENEKNELNICAEALKSDLEEISKAFFDGYKEQGNKFDIEAVFEKCAELCKEIIKAFEGINCFYEKNKEKLACTDKKDILEGIYSTVDIKIESLKDSLLEFKNEGEALKKKLEKEQGFNDRTGSAFVNGLIEALKNATNKAEIKISAYISDFLSQERERFEKIAKDKADKIVLKFKKEQLLFEITTFEEILNYSVSHLRQSEDKLVLNYVAEIDKAVLSINQKISDYGIVIISPKPHELFNGKENEVLMAEKNDDFKKGEIIKVMNSGFKENDFVIIRANVIAAK